MNLSLYKKITKLLLLTFIFSIFLSPIPSFGADPAPARATIVSTVGDGLRYYAVFQYKGVQYRSDEMGPVFNTEMWKLLSDEDKRKVTSNFSFATNHRISQFGNEGSALLADWSNEVTGWKAAGETWQINIANREYPELTAYFGEGNSADLQIGEYSLFDVNYELKNYSGSTKQLAQYQSAFELSENISLKFEAGQAIYNKLAELKAMQIANAFKAGSEVLLRDIIIDNLLIPNITPSAGKASEVIASCLNLIKDRVLGIYDALQKNPSAGEILQAMQDILNELESSADKLRAEINSDLTDLSSQMDTPRELEAQKDKEDAGLVVGKISSVEESSSTTFAWTAESTDYSSPTEAQVIEEANGIKSDFQALLADILTEKNRLYNLLGYDDGLILANHPNYVEKYEQLMHESLVSVPLYTSINPFERIDPVAHFTSYFPYTAIETAVDGDGTEIINDWQTSIVRLEDYIQQTEDFIANETFRQKLEEIVKKVNGLKDFYSIYTGKSLLSDVFGVNTVENIRSNLETMLTNEGLVGLPPAANSDYRVLLDLKDYKNKVESNRNNFIAESTDFKNTTATAAAEYDSLYTNLQNSATYMYGAYLALKELCDESPYINNKNVSAPIIDQLYINIKIASAPEGQAASVINEVLDDLKEFRELETLYMHRIHIGRIHSIHDAKKLDSLLHELGIYNNDSAYKNLGGLIGKTITDSSQYLSADKNLHNLYLGQTVIAYSDVSDFIDTLEGTSEAYYTVLLIADEIEYKTDYLHSLDNEDFNTAINDYKSKLAAALTLPSGVNQLQSDNVQEQYDRGNKMLLDLESGRSSGSGTILVTSIDPVYADSSTTASEIVLESGMTLKLAAVILPEDATNKAVSWQSSNSEIVTIDNQGLLVAVSDGNATITVSSLDGNASASCNVLVQPVGSGDDSTSGSDDPLFLNANAQTTPFAPSTDAIISSLNLNAVVDTFSGIAQIPVTITEMATLTAQAQRSETAGQKAVIEIKVDIPVETKSTELQIPKTSLADAVNATSADLRISTPLANITFNNQALQAINNSAGVNEININISAVNNNILPAEVLEIVVDRPVYDFSVRAGDSEVSTFGDGKAHVSVPYTPEEGEDEEAIVVYYIDNNNNLKTVRGAYNPATYTVDFVVSHFSQYALGYNKVGFKDVAEGDEYAPSISFLAARKIIKGVGDGYFAPEGSLTRAQSLVMIMNAYGITDGEMLTANFADAGDTYYTKYLSTAKSLNLVNGIGNNLFAPERNINRQEMYAMIYNVLKKLDELPLKNTDSIPENFTDYSDISPWAYDVYKIFIGAGTIKDDKALLSPLSEASRYEMAQLLYSLLKV